MNMFNKQADRTSPFTALVGPLLTVILGSSAGCNQQRDDQLVTPAPVNKPERDRNASDLVEKVRDVFEAATPEDKQDTEQLVRDCIQLASDSDKRRYRDALSEELANHTQKFGAGSTASEEIADPKILLLQDLMSLCAD
jgi:hypothetical protein